jgi:hypothetical protein
LCGDCWLLLAEGVHIHDLLRSSSDVVMLHPDVLGRLMALNDAFEEVVIRGRVLDNCQGVLLLPNHPYCLAVCDWAERYAKGAERS